MCTSEEQTEAMVQIGTTFKRYIQLYIISSHRHFTIQSKEKCRVIRKMSQSQSTMSIFNAATRNFCVEQTEAMVQIGTMLKIISIFVLKTDLAPAA